MEKRDEAREAFPRRAAAWYDEMVARARDAASEQGRPAQPGDRLGCREVPEASCDLRRVRAVFFPLWTPG